MNIEKKLADLGIELLDTPTPAPGNFLRGVQTGNLLFVSGHTPRLPDDTSMHRGRLGQDITIEQGYEAARQAAVNCLSAIKATIGDLDKVKRVVKLLVMVNSAPDFGNQPKVANGASDLLIELYGDKGRHARSAVGMNSLPNINCVEIEMIVEVES